MKCVSRYESLILLLATLSVRARLHGAGEIAAAAASVNVTAVTSARASAVATGKKPKPHVMPKDSEGYHADGETITSDWRSEYGPRAADAPSSRRRHPARWAAEKQPEKQPEQPSARSTAAVRGIALPLALLLAAGASLSFSAAL
eukprot:TRINITY_DN10713_c0_g1_i2.p1 TRINITY_DN10713_c0_g1~~TRINITY_DN10713_c0_g1_i2.p1  ORF type:complete len:145 (-),score=30.41 TRINITY_DN10713_c0_g1_i2:75-509(-)